MVKENIDISDYPEPKGNSQHNEFVGIIFKNNLAMLKSCNMLFDENKRLKEIIDKLIDNRDSAVSKCEQLEKEVDWLIDEIIMSESKKCPLCDCPQKAPDSPTESESIAFLNGCRKCWREAVQMAVEQQNERK